MTDGAILVTGATGFLGGALARELLAQGEPVIASGRDLAKLEDLQKAGARILQCDLRDMQGLTPLFSAGPIKAIVHAAALASPWGRRADFMSSNITATQNLVRAAGRLAVRRFVFISSSSVYFSFCDKLTISEDAPLPPPINAYAFSKQQAEQIVLAAHEIGPVVLRPRAIYGRDDTVLLPRLLRAAERNPLPLLRNGAAVSDLTYVDDVVTAAIKAFRSDDAAIGQIFNISSGEALTIKNVIETACRCSGAPAPRWRKMPLAPLLAAARVLETVHAFWPGRPEPRVTPYTLGLIAYSQTLDITKARRVLNWNPEISFAEGVRRTFGGARAAS